jgi:hypothetical protein
VTSLNATELTAKFEEDLDDCIAWIDWRSEEEEVVQAVQEQIAESLDCSWEGDEFFVHVNGEKLRIPLTFSRCDRYVTISSLAEILKEKYVFFLRDGYQGNDTHGLLIVTKECAADLRGKYGTWLNKYFGELVPGIDNFSGLRVPYLGNENHNPNLRAELEAMHATEAEFAQHLQSSPAVNKIVKDLRMQLGTATPKEKLAFYARRFWWLIPLLAWYWLR